MLMPKLSVRERLLYKLKKYSHLRSAMHQTADGAARFNRLVEHDVNLQAWLSAEQHSIAQEIIRNTQFYYFMKQRSSASIFEMYEHLGRNGFVTLEQAATAFNVPRNEMRERIKEYPALFVGFNITVTDD